MKDLYICTDIEADGPIPGEYSMLSIGAIAIDEEGKIFGDFYKKLKKLPGAKQHPATMMWWKQNKEAYEEATANPEDPKKVMSAYLKWSNDMKEKTKAQELVFLGWPLGYDYMFVYWYLAKFIDDFKTVSPFKLLFTHNGVDFTSYAMGMLNLTFTDALVKNLPKKWFNVEIERTHKAVDDAKRQALIFINMIRDDKNKHREKLR